MIEAAKIPAINPIRHFRYNAGDDDFFYNYRKRFEQTKPYCYTYNFNDTITFQIGLALGAFSSFAYELIDENENVYETASYVTMNPLVVTLGSFVYYHFVMSAGSNEGIFFGRFTGTLTDGQIVTILSEPIHVANHENTILIEYGNSENDWNTYFFRQGHGLLKDKYVTFTLRVKGGVLSKDYKQESDTIVYFDEDKNATILSGTPFEVLGFTFGDNEGLPNYMGKIINMLSICDNITIDNVAYSRNDGAKLEQSDSGTWARYIYKMEFMAAQNQTDKLITVPANTFDGIGYMAIGSTFIIQ